MPAADYTKMQLDLNPEYVGPLYLREAAGADRKIHYERCDQTASYRFIGNFVLFIDSLRKKTPAPC
jgi:hypothetical protein